MDIIRATGSAVGRCPSVSANGLIWTVATAGGEGTTVAHQTRVTLGRLDSLLAAAGTNKHRIVEAVIYLTDMSTKDEMDAVWCEWIPSDGWPCRACVGVDLAPGDLVEIKATALVR